MTNNNILPSPWLTYRNISELPEILDNNKNRDNFLTIHANSALDNQQRVKLLFPTAIFPNSDYEYYALNMYMSVVPPNGSFFARCITRGIAFLGDSFGNVYALSNFDVVITNFNVKIEPPVVTQIAPNVHKIDLGILQVPLPLTPISIPGYEYLYTIFFLDVELASFVTTKVSAELILKRST